MDFSIFKELLFTDTARGKHATGIIQVKGQCREITTFKLAVPAPQFLELAECEMTGFINNTVAVGHNRHATKGASGMHRNAHPFVHGHISLVHNGSLTSHFNITPSGESFTVDSEAIARAFEVDGAEVTIPKLRGAFALVWVDSSDNTLNFVRNSERPLAIAFNTTANKIWWASEIDMLNWSINRDTYTRSPVRYDEMIDMDEGEWIKIPITATGIDLANMETKEVDVSESVYSFQGYNRNRVVQGLWDKNRGRYLLAGETLQPDPVITTGTAKRTALEFEAGRKVVGEHVTPFTFGATREIASSALAGLVLDEKGRTIPALQRFIGIIDTAPDAAILEARIGVFITGFESYTTVDSGAGQLKGVMMEYPFSHVAIHGMKRSVYDELVDKSGGMISSYLLNILFPTNGYTATLDDATMSQFTIVLKADQIRRANINDFEWNMDHIPEAAKEPVAVEQKTLESKILEFPKKIVTLKDDSKLQEGGTAVYIGEADHPIVPNLRYTVVGIKMVEAVLMVTTIINGNHFDYRWDLWGQAHAAKIVAVS